MLGVYIRIEGSRYNLLQLKKKSKRLQGSHVTAAVSLSAALLGTQNIVRIYI